MSEKCNTFFECMKEFIKDIKTNGLINIIMFLVISIGILPIMSLFREIDTIIYIIWYISLLIQCIYTVYIIYKVKKDDAKDQMSLTIYNFFTTGGFESYQYIFLTMELQPLFEYIILFMIILLPIFKKNTFKEKVLFVFAKIGIFHVISSFMLMNWKDFTVDYNRKI